MKARFAQAIIGIFISLPIWAQPAAAAEIQSKDDAIQLVKSKFTPEEIAEIKQKVQGGMTPELKEEIKQEVISRLSSDEYQSLLNVQKQITSNQSQGNNDVDKSNQDQGNDDVTTEEVKPISIYINDEIQDFGQPPVIIQGTTLVPFRGILEALGADVSWNPETQTVTANKAGTNIVLTIDSDSAEVNGIAQAMDVPAQIMHSRTMVPLRFLSERLGATVDWNADSRSVVIKTN